MVRRLLPVIVSICVSAAAFGAVPTYAADSNTDIVVQENSEEAASFTDENVDEKEVEENEAVENVTKKPQIKVKKSLIRSVEIKDEGIKITYKKLSKVSGYIVERREGKNGKYKEIATISSKKKAVYVDADADQNKTYYYRVKAYKKSDGKKYYGKYSKAKKIYTEYTIMGESNASVDEMVALYKKSGKKYPTRIYKKKGAANIREFCKILAEEAEAEGVRDEVVFAQAMLETGYLQFGGDVKAKQCNFAGLGAVGGGAKGKSYKNVRIGLRAQIQHLKAYASNESLNKKCVDSRFKYVMRGSAIYVSYLAIGKNPKKVGWAADDNYGTKIMSLVNQL